MVNKVRAKRVWGSGGFLGWYIDSRWPFYGALYLLSVLRFAGLFLLFFRLTSLVGGFVSVVHSRLHIISYRIILDIYIYIYIYRYILAILLSKESSDSSQNRVFLRIYISDHHHSICQVITHHMDDLSKESPKQLETPDCMCQPCIESFQQATVNKNSFTNQLETYMLIDQ
jgi:hypothetical protein